MKRAIAMFLMSIFSTLGFVVVDKTMDERVVALETQIAVLQEAVENAGATVPLQVGDTLMFFWSPQNNFTGRVYIDGYNEDKDDYDPGMLITVDVTSFSATVIGKVEDKQRVEYYACPNIVRWIITGVTDPAAVGRVIYTHRSGSNNIRLKSDDRSTTAVISSDGSFRIEMDFYMADTNYVECGIFG